MLLVQFQDVTTFGPTPSAWCVSQSSADPAFETNSSLITDAPPPSPSITKFPAAYSDALKAFEAAKTMDANN